MNFNNISTNLEDGIYYLTISREDKMNALNIETIAEIGLAIDEVYSNAAIKGAIITGKGNKAFIAGADIAEFANFSSSEGKQMAQKGHEVFNKIECCPKPIIAAVNGFALGGGCELAMACHVRIASDTAQFGQPEVNLGIIPGYGGTQRLARLVGKGKAMELILTGDMIDAEEALKFGLVNHVVAQDELMVTATKLAQKINKKGPLAVAKSIALINAYYEDKDGFEMEIEEFGNCFNTEDFKEGTNAFVEKRKAEFKGE